MVDPHTGVRTIERTAGQIADAASVAADRLAIAFEELERLEVARRRGDAETQSGKWLLDHDYLARAVREADRRANRWMRALEEGAEKLRLAGRSWSAWWRGLLSPTAQMGFIADRVRGRFQYGTHRRYAFVSTVRLVPYVSVILALAGVGALEYQQRQLV